MGTYFQICCLAPSRQPRGRILEDGWRRATTWLCRLLRGGRRPPASADTTVIQEKHVLGDRSGKGQGVEAGLSMLSVILF